MDGAPAEGPDGDERLTGTGRQPHRLHQSEVKEAQSKAARHVGQVVLTKQDPGQAHQDGPQHQQDPQRDGQHQMGQEELGHHGRSACVRRRERVRVQSHAVQKAGTDVPWSFAPDQFLNACHSQDVKNQRWKRIKRKSVSVRKYINLLNMTKTGKLRNYKQKMQI